MNKRTTAALLALILMSAGAAAQEKADKPQKAPTPLKVQVVFARYQGERKVSSMPYTLSVNADDRPTAMRVGIMVPVLVVVEKGPTVAYKDVSTNVDCSAAALGDGRYKLEFSVEHGAVHSTDASPLSAQEPAAFHAPVLRTFRSQTTLFLRDGQTGQYIAATDPITGEVLKIDVTLNVVK